MANGHQVIEMREPNYDARKSSNAPGYNPGKYRIYAVAGTFSLFSLLPLLKTHVSVYYKKVKGICRNLKVIHTIKFMELNVYPCFVYSF